MILGENKYGRYCVPESSAHRFAIKAILAGEVHEPDTIDLIIERAQGKTVVTAGTYFGDFLPALHQAGANVVAFEPSRTNWLHTIGTLYLNGIADIDVACVALGEAVYPAKVVGTETYRKELFHLGGGSYVTTDRHVQHFSHACTVRPLDILLPARDVSVIQLDVERYEEKALMGALRTIERCLPVIILETVPEEWVEKNLFPLGYVRTGKVHQNTVFEAA